MYRNQVRLHVLILFIKNKVAFQRGCIAVFKKKPGFFIIIGRLTDSALFCKISSRCDLPSRAFLGRTINKIVTDIPFLLCFAIEAEIRRAACIPALGQISMYVVFYVYFVTGVHVACLHYIFRYLHTATAFFSFNIAEKGRIFWRNTRRWQHSFRQKTAGDRADPFFRESARFLPYVAWLFLHYMPLVS